MRIGIAFISLLLATGDGAADAQKRAITPAEAGLQIHPSLISLESEAGRRLLRESGAKEDFVTLAVHSTTQRNLAFCGVASATMVLNGLGIARPVSEGHQPYRLFTQENFFTPAVERVISRDSVAHSGMTLRELGEALKAHRITVEVTHAAEGSMEEFRARAVQTLNDGDSFLIVNYLRRAIHQELGGHISPLAAYHAGEDRFLILDVARYKYPPVWVKADALWKAMLEIDGSSHRSRGYLVVRSAVTVQAATGAGEGDR